MALLALFQQLTDAAENQFKSSFKLVFIQALAYSLEIIVLWILTADI